MVYLNRIYTKTGDGGETSLGDGSRVAKTDPRIAACGGVDELNAVLGMCLAAGLEAALAEGLRQIQHDLFDLGADLCVPWREGESGQLRITPGQVERLERWIDAAVARLAPLTSFILPGGSPAAAHLHWARTVCRRAELGVVALAAETPIPPPALHYLNRLSDLLFVWARLVNDEGRSDVLWQPGCGRAGAE